MSTQPPSNTTIIHPPITPLLLLFPLPEARMTLTHQTNVQHLQPYQAILLTSSLHLCEKNYQNVDADPLNLRGKEDERAKLNTAGFQLSMGPATHARLDNGDEELRNNLLRASSSLFKELIGAASITVRLCSHPSHIQANTRHRH